MEREKKKASFGTSWADEVEREEEEEAQKQRMEIEAKSNRGKTNPFGAARPREAVLEERGVDWKKLDQDLELNSYSNLRKDKKLKENILLTPQITRHGRFPLGSMVLKQAQPQQSQYTSPLVPPLRYPPKNIMAIMEQIRKGRKDLKDDASMENSCNVRVLPGHHKERLGYGSFVSDERAIVDLNIMERAGDFNRRSERRMSFAYGDQRERTYGGLRSAGYGVKERINAGNMSDEGVDLRNAIRMKKRRLSAVYQPGPCNQIRRQGKQSRK